MSAMLAAGMLTAAGAFTVTWAFMMPQSFMMSEAHAAEAGPRVGALIRFGRYEQNNRPDKEEDITWRVLAVDGEKALLISEYGLDAQRYNKEREYTTWAECSLRTWLNEEFFTNAFSEEEKSRINPTELKTEGSKDTKDLVFLLSDEEAGQYFRSDKRRQCTPTAYAVANGVAKSEENGFCRWWLRTPGEDGDDADGVFEDGSVFTNGRYVDRHNDAVRPVIRINWTGMSF